YEIVTPTKRSFRAQSSYLIQITVARPSTGNRISRIHFFTCAVCADCTSDQTVGIQPNGRRQTSRRNSRRRPIACIRRLAGGDRSHSREDRSHSRDPLTSSHLPMSRAATQSDYPPLPI